MRISKHEYQMALALERRALELLGDRAPAWALEDAGQLGNDVHVADAAPDAADRGRQSPAERPFSEVPQPDRRGEQLVREVRDALVTEGFGVRTAKRATEAAVRESLPGAAFEQVLAQALLFAQPATSATSEDVQPGARFVSSARVAARAVPDTNRTEQDERFINYLLIGKPWTHCPDLAP